MGNRGEFYHWETKNREVFTIFGLLPGPLLADVLMLLRLLSSILFLQV